MAVKTWKTLCVQHQSTCETLAAEGIVGGVMKKQKQKVLLDVTSENCY